MYMDKDFLITKSNELIVARYNLSLEEQRLILVLASMVQPNDIEFKEYTIYISQFLELLNVKDCDKYALIPDIAKDLMKKVIDIDGKNERIMFPWLAGAKHNKKNASIKLIFHPYLKPFLLNLKSNFVSYKLGNVLLLNSKYSIRLYEIFKSNEFKTNFKVAIKELKFMFMIESEYNLYADFKKRVIEYAKKEINAKTDINVTYEELKEGRKVIALNFLIEKKDGKKTLRPLNEEIESLKKKLKEFAEDDVNKIYIESGRDYNKTLIAYEYLKLKQNVNKSVGYMIRLVREEKLKKPVKSTKSKQASFEQRNYTKEDFKNLENSLLGRDKKYPWDEINDICSNCTSDDCEHCSK